MNNFTEEQAKVHADKIVDAIDVVSNLVQEASFIETNGNNDNPMWHVHRQREPVGLLTSVITNAAYALGHFRELYQGELVFDSVDSAHAMSRCALDRVRDNFDQLSKG